MTQTQQDFIRNIRELLEERGWTQRQLSEASGIPENSISNYLKGKFTPQVGAINQLCRAFSVSASRLFASEREEGIVRIQKIRPTPLEAHELVRGELVFLSRIPQEIRALLEQADRDNNWDATLAGLKRTSQASGGQSEKPRKKSR